MQRHLLECYAEWRKLTGGRLAVGERDARAILQSVFQLSAGIDLSR